MQENRNPGIELANVCKDFDAGGGKAAAVIGLGKRFSTLDVPPALGDVSASIKAGSITGLVGPDGAGKTTLLRILAGLLKADSGTVSVTGLNPWAEGDKLRTVLGYMPQKFGLYEDLSVQENLSLYADLRSVALEDRPALFEKLLSFTSLAPFTKRLSGRLSGGMKQKLGLACSLMGSPHILLLDEPSVGVDPISRRELWNMVTQLSADGITVIWSTSYLDEAEKCDNILLMNLGKLLYHGAPSELTNSMQGHSVQIKGLAESRRNVLQKAMGLKEVQDGVIQGRHVRLVLREAKVLPDLPKLLENCKVPSHEAEMVSMEFVPPRLEDAFIAMLGGGPDGHSELAELMGKYVSRPACQEDSVDNTSVIELQSIPKLSEKGFWRRIFEKKSATADYCANPIEADHLTRKFGAFVATDDINFSVKRGEIFGLLGPNGAGKSTTFKMLCGLLVPSSGSARVLGIDLAHNPGKARQQLGYMAQKFSLYADLSVVQNLYFFSGIYGIKKNNQKRIIERMLEIFDLKPYANQASGNLPLGFKQRLSLACAVMHAPAILFLDEPTSGVDPVTRREFWNHINGLVEYGVTVLVTTHFMDEAEYCDRIALVYKGKIIASGTPDDLKSSAANEKSPDPSLEDAFIDLVIRSENDLNPD